jgi:hypothetical protein
MAYKELFKALSKPYGLERAVADINLNLFNTLFGGLNIFLKLFSIIQL